MALSTDVRLHRDRGPVFPDRCVACGRGQPDASFRIRRRPTRWLSVLTALPGGRRTEVHAPACAPCVARMTSRRVVSLVVTILLVTLGVFLALGALGSYDGPFKKPLGIGGALLALVPWILVEVLWPPVFDITVFRDTVDYEFADADYADEFEAMNR